MRIDYCEYSKYCGDKGDEEKSIDKTKADENPANAPKFKIVNINSNRKRMLKKAIKLQCFIYCN